MSDPYANLDEFSTWTPVSRCARTEETNMVLTLLYAFVENVRFGAVFFICADTRRVGSALPPMLSISHLHVEAVNFRTKHSGR